MVKQGSEDPIRLIFDRDMEGITAFICALISYGKIVKEYGLEDIKIEGNVVELPVTQEESLRFEPGEMIVEASWRDADGEKLMADHEKIYVAPRYIRKVI